jgi:flagella basal body P-ring formation protein FlgA
MNLLPVYAGSTGQQLLLKAQTALRTALMEQGYHHIQLRPGKVPLDQQESIPSFSTEIAKTFPVASYVCVRLHTGKKIIPVWFHVKASQTVWLAEKPINGNTRIKPHHLALKMQNIAGLHYLPFRGDPRNQWLTRALKKGQIVGEKDIKEPPLVERGETVQINVRHHQVSIVTQGIAQQNAYSGQTLKLINPQSKKTFTAKVIGRHLAEVL